MTGAIPEHDGVFQKGLYARYSNVPGQRLS